MFAMMMYPTSARVGFKMYKDETLGGKKIERNLLGEMYKRENEIRLSKEMQEEMERKMTSGEMSGYVELVEEIQRRVVKEFGFGGSEEDLSLFRQGLSMYPEDSELQQIPYYSRFNRANDGDLKEGDSVRDVQLVDTEGTKSTLFSFYNSQVDKSSKAGLPFVLLAGSIS